MGGAKKDPNAPKRPLSAYFIFMGLFDHVIMDPTTYFILGEKRAEVKAANPDWKIGDVAKVAFFLNTPVTHFFVLYPITLFNEHLLLIMECNCFYAGDGENVASSGREGEGPL